MSKPRMNMVPMEAMSSRPRIQRFCMRWPAPGMSQATAGATTAIAVTGCDAWVVFTEVFAIQIITISR